MNPYADLSERTVEGLSESVDEMIRERRLDVKDFDNIQNRFISGRRVGKIPTGASDVSSSDKIGDFNIADVSGTVYLYTLLSIGGTAEWRRVALSSW